MIEDSELRRSLPWNVGTQMSDPEGRVEQRNVACSCRLADDKQIPISRFPEYISQRSEFILDLQVAFLQQPLVVPICPPTLFSLW